MDHKTLELIFKSLAYEQRSMITQDDLEEALDVYEAMRDWNVVKRFLIIRAHSNATNAQIAEDARLEKLAREGNPRRTRKVTEFIGFISGRAILMLDNGDEVLTKPIEGCTYRDGGDFLCTTDTDYDVSSALSITEIYTLADWRNSSEEIRFTRRGLKHIPEMCA